MDILLTNIVTPNSANTLSSKNISYLNNTIVTHSSGTTDLPVDMSYFRKTGTTTYERWYCSAPFVFGVSSIALGANQMRAIPFIVSKRSTFDRIAAEITVGGTAGSVVRLGIYDSVNLVPTNRILDAGTIAGDSATFQSITINQTLAPGLYWLCSHHNSVANITFRTIPSISLPSVLGVTSALGAAAGTGAAVTNSSTYAVFPPTFDQTGIAVNTSASQMLISLRLSA